MDVHKQTEVTQLTMSLDRSFSVSSLGGSEDRWCTQDTVNTRTFTSRQRLHNGLHQWIKVSQCAAWVVLRTNSAHRTSTWGCCMYKSNQINGTHRITSTHGRCRYKSNQIRSLFIVHDYTMHKNEHLSLTHWFKNRCLRKNRSIHIFSVFTSVSLSHSLLLSSAPLLPHIYIHTHIFNVQNICASTRTCTRTRTHT